MGSVCVLFYHHCFPNNYANMTRPSLSPSTVSTPESSGTILREFAFKRGKPLDAPTIFQIGGFCPRAVQRSISRSLLYSLQRVEEQQDRIGNKLQLILKKLNLQKKRQYYYERQLLKQVESMRRKFVQQQKLLETLQNPKLQQGTHPKSSDLAGSYALNEGNP